jgi:hypothetical protein
MIEPLLKEPALRLIFELVGVKTSEEKRAEFCAGVPGDFVSAAKEGLVGPVEPLKGGKRRTRRRAKKDRRRHSRTKRKTFS